MRQHGGRSIADNAVEIQEVEIERTRSPFLTSAAPGLLFDSLKITKKRFRRHAGSDANNGVKEVRLIDFSIRGSPYKR